ncbi:hypothetical protein EXP36_00115 [Salmonella enterica subsp. enterica serovar Weltevreden]|nr:hypothetical protein [Salmonella enterica subsp. enterica serovar Weltevreden]ECD7026935.1 hypothetical protein [Salmonella enterica subsp. enterica serovar Heidelberg]MJU45236.1 hypothetical protein [Salmonella enterica subsp. enterica serovar Stanley]
MDFSDAQFAEFLSNPRVKREWDNLTNSVRRQDEEEIVHVTAQVLLVSPTGNVFPMQQEIY